MSRSSARLKLRAIEESRRALFLWTDKRGVAAIEFSLFAMFLTFAIMNVVDVSTYIYQRLEVENATQVGAQAAWKACDLAHLPASTNCPALPTAVQTAVKSTSLGTKVSLQTGSPSEGYYCVNATNALQYISGTSSKPADCTAAGTPSLKPGDYIKVQTTFPYAPLFPGITIAGFFATPITRTALMRLG
jgi:Flp pilus assembly protein TadG